MYKLLCAVALVMLSSAAQCETSACEHLRSRSLPHTRIVEAETVSAGTFRLPNSSNPDLASGKPFSKLPPFCRVVLEISPARGSAIDVELWMPTSHWNGRFLGNGNGGFAGEIDYRELATGLAQGYATAATDTGHDGEFTDARWALGHPQKVIDFGYRAIHQMTLQSKSLLGAYYARPQRYSYFESCSTGGRQGLMEAQRFPADYDGILAGAPANSWTRLMTSAVFLAQKLTVNPQSYISPSKLPAIYHAVLNACDAQDGVKDGIVSDPRSCKFNPSVLLCKGAPTDTCLTASQVAALQAVYSGTHDANGRDIYPGYLPGGELGSNGWGPWLFGPVPRQSLMFLFGTRYFSDMVYEDPHWNYGTFAVDKGLARGLRQTGSILDATNPDLGSFAKRGGKLILYHGWSDAAIPPMSTVEYYNSVRISMGPSSEDAFVRLFMVPGMQHCELGPGPNSFGQNGPSSASGIDDARHDIRLALKAWVEKDKAPDEVIAAKYSGEGDKRKIVMTRPLCPYPQVAVYRGHGNTDEASSFRCSVPR